MPGEKLYVGSKIIKAFIMSECDFLRVYKKELVRNREDQHGYCVIYPGGYRSWSPKKVFEEAYREVSSAEKDLVIN